MATQDDTVTVRTIIDSLRAVVDQLETSALTRVGERDAVALLELLAQAVASDVHPARTAALLFGDSVGDVRPFNVVACLMHPQLSLSTRLRCAATRCFQGLFNAATTADTLPLLERNVAAAVLELDILPLLLGSLRRPDVDPAECDVSAELLFVISVQLRVARELLTSGRALGGAVPSAADSGVTVLINFLAKPLADGGAGATTTTMAMEHVAATLRVLADLHPDALIDRDLCFVAVCVSVLELEVSANRTSSLSTLLVEALCDVFARFPSCYLEIHAAQYRALVTSIPAPLTENLSPRFVAVVEMLIAVTDVELRDAAVRLTHRVLSIEGCIEGGDVLLRSVFVSPDAWKRAIGLAGQSANNGAAIHFLQLQTSVVATAISPSALAACTAGFMDQFPALCVLVDPTRSAQGAMREATLILGLMCLKFPHVRAAIGDMVQGYDNWAQRLRGTLHHLLARVGPTSLAGVVVVDGLNALLNDGAQLEHVDAFDARRLAHAIVVEQTRRAQAGVVQPPATHILRQRADAWSPRAKELAAELALALLVEATGMALAPGAMQSVDREASFSAVETSTAAEPASNATMARARDAAATPRAHTPSRARVLAAFGEVTPQSTRAPFRPASSRSTLRSATPSARARSAGPTHAHGRGAGAPSDKRLVDSVRGDASTDDDAFVSMAIMMHLPISFGIHYNRRAKAVVRTIHAPGVRGAAPWVQPVHRDPTQSWTSTDVRDGDLYVLFVPFHKITVDRFEAEIRSVERQLLLIRKQLVLTPQQQRARRWFLHDMLNFVLPKTDLLLRAFLALLQSYGAGEVVYAMGVVRLMDDRKQSEEDIIHRALESVDSAMPAELLKFSSGRLRDVLHSGNLPYAVRRLREHFGSAQAGGSSAAGGDSRYAAPAAAPSQLADIDREIAALEHRIAAKQFGHAGGDESEDDVESAFDEPTASSMRPDQRQAAMDDPQRYLAENRPPTALHTHAASILRNVESGPGVRAPAFRAPTADEFDAMYAAVENPSRGL